MMWILWTILIIIGFILLFFIFFSLVMFFITLKAKSPWNQDNKPWSINIDDPKLKQRVLNSMDYFRQNGELVEITSFDGYKLKGKLFKKDNAKYNVICFHGYRGKPEGDFSLIFDWLKDLDVNVLLIYQRGVFPSQGKYITMGVNESKDVISWTNYLNNKSNLPTLLWGVSMGTASIINSLKEKPHKNVVGIVADCGYTSIYEQFLNQLGEYITKPIARIVLFFSNLWCHLILHFGFHNFDTRKILKNNHIPILFVHGNDDKFVIKDFTLQNYEINKGKKQLLLVDKAGHIDAFKYGEEEYKKEVLKLLKNMQK